MEVTEAGDIIYNYPEDFRKRLLRKSVGRKIEVAKDFMYPKVMTTARMAFGFTVIASIALGTVTMVALMNGSNESDDRRDSGSPRPVRSTSSVNMNLMLNVNDIVYYLDYMQNGPR